MGKNIDLHMHSLYSDDGELSPEDIIKIGKKEGMDIMALTDHNSVKGVDEMIKHGEEAGIRIISGVEIDCVYKGINLHMLGYGIDYKRKEFIDIEEEIFKKEIAIARTKIEKLKENTNLIVNEEKIFEIANGKIVTGRKGSAMSGYNPKRLQYQLQELKMVDNLLSDWNLDSSNFVNTVKSRILMSNIYNITKQNLSVNRKVKLVKDTCERQEIEDFIKNDSSALNPLIKLLLKCRMYVVLIYLKKIQMVLQHL